MNRRRSSRTKDNDWGFAWLGSNDAGSGAYGRPGELHSQKQLDLKRFRSTSRAENRKPIDAVRPAPRPPRSRLKGEIDAGDSYLPTDQVERLSKVKDVVVQRNESMRIFIIRMNNTKPPFDNVHFRRCMSHAFNYDAFIGVILKNFAERNPAPIRRTSRLPGGPEGLRL